MSKRLGFLPEIDALRAVAVIMTLGAHFIPKSSSFYVPYLWYGVDLFFVISGFLITSILLNTRLSASKPSNKIIFKNFYIRRALRLFPIYYIFILFFFVSRHLFDLYIWKDEFNLYFFTYLQNWYFFKIGAFNNMFSHLWSLGIEEQFYVLWPFIVLYVPIKYLRNFFIFLIGLSILLNGIFIEIPLFRSLTFSNFHTLGSGALLAWFFVKDSENLNFKWLVANRKWLSLLSFLFLVLFLIYKPFNNTINSFITETVLAISASSLVLTSAYGWNKPISYLTLNKLIRYIGKISYGIYLFHLPLPALFMVVEKKLNLSLAPDTNSIWNMFFYTCLAIILASISYFFIEKRFLLLKAKFDK